MNDTSVLIVDDDMVFARLLFFHLQQAGYHCIIESNVDIVLALLDSKFALDAFIIDVELGQSINGLELAGIISKKTCKPILMVSSRDSEDTVIRGLDAGAHQYLTKPYRKNELLARLRCALRNQQTGVTSDQVSDTMMIDMCTRMLHWSSSKVRVTEKEAKILHFMLQREGEGLSRDAIFNEINGEGQLPYSRCIDALVGRVRKKIQEVGAPYRINYLRSFGYVLHRLSHESMNGAQ